jgi:hypothetical protein
MTPQGVTNRPRDRRLSTEMARTIIQSHPDVSDARRWLTEWNFRERCLLALIALMVLCLIVSVGGPPPELQSTDFYGQREEATDLR